MARAFEWWGIPVQRYDIKAPKSWPVEVERGDIVFTSVPQLLDVNWLQRQKRRGVSLACWYFDYIFDYQRRDAAYMPRLRLMNAVFSTDGFDDLRYRKAEVYCREWLSQAAPQDARLVPIPADTPAHDVLFVGAVNNGNRRELIAQLSKRFDVGVYGNRTHGRRIWGAERQALIRSAKVVIGANFCEDVPGYWSNRVYLTLASRGFFLCHHVDGLNQMFIPGEHYAEFTDDPVGAVSYWLERPEERARIAAAGHKHCMENHTYIHRVGELIARLRWKGLLK